MQSMAEPFGDLDIAALLGDDWQKGPPPKDKPAIPSPPLSESTSPLRPPHPEIVELRRRVQELTEENRALSKLHSQTVADMARERAIHSVCANEIVRVLPGQQDMPRPWEANPLAGCEAQDPILSLRRVARCFTHVVDGIDDTSHTGRRLLQFYEGMSLQNALAHMACMARESVDQMIKNIDHAKETNPSLLRAEYTSPAELVRCLAEASRNRKPEAKPATKSRAKARAKSATNRRRKTTTQP